MAQLYHSCPKCNSVMYKTHTSWDHVDKGYTVPVNHYKCSNKKCQRTKQERGDPVKIRR